VTSPQKQNGSKDCGLFAIAFATAISFGQFPLKKSLQQESMRAHLAACFQYENITLFPYK